jgi:hypothetical protein
MKRIKVIFFAVLFLFGINAAFADDQLLKPFVLASKGAGDMTAKIDATKAALTANGFAIAGTYSPYPSAMILIVTNDELKKNAAESEHGGFGAAQRIAVTKVKNEIQVSYTNPVYMANVYRMKNDLKDIASKLQTALGKLEEFGAKGMTASDAHKYHYMFSMPYFDEPLVLAEYPSYDEALAAVETGLASGKEGVSKVFLVNIPGKQETLFGVSMTGKPGKAKVATDAAPGVVEQFGTLMVGADEADQYIMSEIDFKDIKSTAHLPYEILVSGKQVLALHAKFRIAQSFPDLKMAGSHSFVNIMSSPDAIYKALKKTVAMEK